MVNVLFNASLGCDPRAAGRAIVDAIFAKENKARFSGFSVSRRSADDGIIFMKENKSRESGCWCCN